MAQHSRDERSVEWTLLIDGAPDDLRWIHPDVKMVITSHTWHNKNTIRDLEQVYQMSEEVEGLEFQLIEADEGGVAMTQVNLLCFMVTSSINLELVHPSLIFKWMF